MKKIMANYGGVMMLYISFIFILILMCTDFLSPSIPETTYFVSSSVVK